MTSRLRFALGVSLLLACNHTGQVFGLLLDLLIGEAEAQIVVDHRHRDVSLVPEYWIERAKEMFKISYQHTSHGEQIVVGMELLRDRPFYADLLAFYDDYHEPGPLPEGALSFWDFYYNEGRRMVGIGRDLELWGNPPSWVTATRAHLDGDGADRNLILWSWCGGVTNATEEEIQTVYLDNMNQLEHDYPNVSFIYMTGHLDGTGESGNLHLRNEQIREYCRQNEKLLFDFADIESWDYDGNYYNDETDLCRWAYAWAADPANDCPIIMRNPGTPDNPSSDFNCKVVEVTEYTWYWSPHTHGLNSYNKGQALWWMLARLAGWDGTPVSEGPTIVTVSLSDATVNEFYSETVSATGGIAPLTWLVSSGNLPDGLSLEEASGEISGSPTQAGTYEFTIQVADSGSYTDTQQLSITVNMLDARAPVITLEGPNPVVLEVNTPYVEPGYSATDNYDGDITADVAVGGTVNHTVLGSYVVRYNVSDSSGNPAEEKTRTVNVVDTTAPVISLAGANPLVLEANTSYAEPGYSATDNYDGDITGSVVVTGSVDHNVSGSYILRYNVSDSSGNPAEEKTRTVDVVKTEPVEIVAIIQSLHGMVQLTWISRPGAMYIVWSCFDLTNGPWYDEATMMTEGTSADWTDSDTAYTWKFYRIEAK